MAFLLEEDDARVLEAAISFVDTFEMDSLHDEAVASPVPCRLDTNADDMTKRAVTNAKKRILRKTGVYSDPNRARTERRREIAYLREEMEKLQIDVQNLQNRKSQPKRPMQSIINSTPQIPNLWQVIANKQRQRREDAERENVRLKLIAERQQKVAEDLTSLFRRRTNQLVNDCNSLMDVSPRHQVVHVVDFCGDIGDFQGLFRHLDAARQEVDTVFAANGLEQMVLTPCDVHIREGDDGNYLEAFSNKVLPFRLSDSTEAAWNHFKGIEKHLGNGNIYEKAAKDFDEANTVIEAFTKEMHANNQRADVKVKQVVRRYIERDHDLVIWVAHVSPAEIRHKMLRGLSYILRGYAKIKRSPVSTPDCEISQLQCCSLISFDLEAEAMYGSEAIRTLTNFLVVNSAMKTQGHQDCIERALVDQVLQRERTMSGTHRDVTYRLATKASGQITIPDVMDDTLSPPNCQRFTDGVIGPVLQRAGLPHFHSFVNVDNVPSASQWTTKENEEIEYRRKQNRLHQARFKKRQQQKVENLEKDIQQLQKELQQLHVRQNILTVGIETTCKTIWQIAAEYFRLFRNGHRAHTQRDFCLATMTTDVVADDNGNGVETILQNWEALSLVFEDIDIELVRLEHCADGGVLASVRSVATLSDTHLVKEGQVSLVASKLQDQRIEMRGWVRFQWSDEMERVDSIRYNVDILSPIMQLLHDLEDTACVFNNANITPESKLVAA